MNPTLIRSRIAALLEQRAPHEQTVRDTLAAITDGQPTEEQATALRSARAAIVAVDAELDQQQTALREALEEETRNANAAALRADMGHGTRTGGAVVGREARTYTPESSNSGTRSFFADAYAAQFGSDYEARERLHRHMTEAAVEGETTQRAVGTSGFGGLVVPQYLLDEAAAIIRNGRVTANIVRRRQLPAQGMALVIPRGTTGAAVASQATENSALQNTDAAWSPLTVPVATIGGQQDVSRQLLERGAPGTDEIIMQDGVRAYVAELDRQVIAGTGASGTLLGILNTSGIGTATAFGAAATAASINAKIAGMVGVIAGYGQGLQAGAIVMHPRRWAALAAANDSTGRPLLPLYGAMNGIGAVNVVGGYSGGNDPNDARQATPVGSLQGLPVFTDANVPTTVGTNSEDVILVLDASSAILWEDGDGGPRQLRFEQTLPQNLTIKMVFFNYSAFTAGRYPQGVGRVGGADTGAGNGLIAPTF